MIKSMTMDFIEDSDTVRLIGTIIRRISESEMFCSGCCAYLLESNTQIPTLYRHDGCFSFFEL